MRRGTRLLAVNERKICVFLRLNMGNKDIAQERTDNLATFIQNL